MLTKRRTLILLAVAVPAIVSAHLAWSQDDSGTSDRAPLAERMPSALLPVSSLRLERVEEHTRGSVYTGELEARRATELGFDSSGLLLEVLAEEGMSVEAGAPLARLDRSRLEASLAGAKARRARAAAQLAELRAGPREEVVQVARAALAEVEEELELARTRLARRESLVEKNAVSREVVDEAERGVDVLESRLEARTHALEELLTGTRAERIDAQEAVTRSLDAEIDALEVELEKTTLLAPFAGTIARRHLDEGAVVAAGQPVLRLVESGVLEVRLGLPPTAARQLRPGEVRPVRVDGYDLEARVLAVLPELDPLTRTATVLFAIPGDAAPVIVGQIAHLRFDEEIAEPGFWLPVSALAHGDRGLWASFALVETEHPRYRIERRDVEVIHTRGDEALVRGTLSDGERVIDRGLHRVVPGQDVRIVDESLTRGGGER